MYEEQLAIERRRARFNADVAQTVRVIAERYRASGAVLTGDVARAILDEAFADVGLASRWPDDAIAALASSIDIPSGAAPLAQGGPSQSSPLLQSIFTVFASPVHADA
ncbi:hypothetical protein F4827_006350 [Paraburkholderia bannensis]|uniref:Uncharacterized protein n=1 Tax=Paraburkholderia bannensis TaxID=765414 RepID=A0A7W9U5S3_9BURK|nr:MULTISPECIES: hypothetical protein [Paraburkholderia]MBB3262294.1 hypothetical protein [Paraburkholderia sp. WP4_3_2]MBB6106475.1 hypothetical protein [Paraburkholderia bannensis]